MIRSMNCPNCGAPYNPAKYQCESCGSFVFMAQDNQFNVPQKAIDEIRRKEADAAEKYPGVYVFGKILGTGEIPLRFGSANYVTSALSSSGGKLLLTGVCLYFSSHAFNAGKEELRIPLEEITDVTYDRNQLISDRISVHTAEKRHRFIVYGGKEWIEKIDHARKNPRPVNAGSAGAGSDYTAQLTELKRLLDAGIITEEEFTIKKRMILGI